MPLFPVLDLEATLQANDKMRIDASRSYATGGDTLVTVEICVDYTAPTEEEPAPTNTFIVVTTNQYLDWQFELSGAAVNGVETITVAVQCTDDAETPNVEVLSGTFTLLSATADNLFSSDDQLRKHEPDILKYLPDARSSYKDIHRRAQSLILAWLDTQGYIDTSGNKYTAASVLDITEVSDWSVMMTLRLIFEGVQNAVDDVFSVKAEKYLKLEEFYRNRAILRIDTNSDGILDQGEYVDVHSGFVVRR